MDDSQANNDNRTERPENRAQELAQRKQKEFDDVMRLLKERVGNLLGENGCRDQNDQGARQTSEVTHVPHSPETKCVACLFAGLGIDFVDYNGTRSSALKDPSCGRDFLASEGQ